MLENSTINNSFALTSVWSSLGWRAVVSSHTCTTIKNIDFAYCAGFIAW